MMHPVGIFSAVRAALTVGVMHSKNWRDLLNYEFVIIRGAGFKLEKRHSCIFNQKVCNAQISIFGAL